MATDLEDHNDGQKDGASATFLDSLAAEWNPLLSSAYRRGFRHAYQQQSTQKDQEKEQEVERRSNTIQAQPTRASDDEGEMPWALKLIFAFYVMVFGVIFLALRWIIQRPWRVAAVFVIVGGIAIVSLWEEHAEPANQPATASSIPVAVSPDDARPAPAKSYSLGPITDPEIATHLTRQIRRTSSDRDPFVVLSLEGDRAWINLNGKNVSLPLVALEGVYDSTIGNKFSRRFTSDDTSLLVQYEVLSSFVIQDMGCERTEYLLSIDLSSSNTKERVEPENYGEGC